MAKKNKKSELPPIPPEFRKLPPVPDWNAYFDPRIKKRAEVNIDGIVAMGMDWNMLKAFWITHQIINAVVAGLDGVNHKTANPAALAEWRSLLLPFVYNRLNTGGDWFTDGPNVLIVAGDMGTIAGLLTGAPSEAGPDQLKAAFKASKTHRTCSAGGVGGGAWCTFDWI